METMIYSIYDVLAESYGPLFQAPNHAVAERNFNKLVLDNNLKESEYHLVQIAKFNQLNGEITPHQETVIGENHE